ncbi:hypothetical protein KSP40_PGU022222 [Platanthera guangdongensis]|uniref:Uncharacterized protein n=1 Tax=Platanthera guangdongensis TaxID=2320717 RepID=A0ABR2MYQ7_9ASPA
MVLWEITAATAYFLGLKRTYRIALRLQRRIFGPRHNKIRQFLHRGEAARGGRRGEAAAARGGDGKTGVALYKGDNRRTGGHIGSLSRAARRSPLLGAAAGPRSRIVARLGLQEAAPIRGGDRWPYWPLVSGSKKAAPVRGGGIVARLGLQKATPIRGVGRRTGEHIGRSSWAARRPPLLEAATGPGSGMTARFLRPPRLEAVARPSDRITAWPGQREADPPHTGGGLSGEGTTRIGWLQCGDDNGDDSGGYGSDGYATSGGFLDICTRSWGAASAFRGDTSTALKNIHRML